MTDIKVKSIFLRPNRIIEIYIWIFISLLVGGRPFYWGVVCGKFRYSEFFMEFYMEILFAILVFLFPFLFQLIFAELPFEYLRNRRFRNIHHEDLASKIDSKPSKKIQHNNIAEETLEIKKEIRSQKEEILLEKYLNQSKDIADKLYSRSGAYLLIGCLIAFFGVLFFYFQTTSLHNSLAPIIKDLSASKILFEYLPRIGTLVFVEAIAFFS